MTQVNMHEQIRMLVELQALDSEIFARKAILDGIPVRIKELDDNIAKESAALKSLDDELKKFQLARKDKEVELQAKEATIKKYKGQLFQVKTNQEYTSLEKEMASIKADSSVLEDAIIELLDKVEEAQKNVAKEKAVVEEAKNKIVGQKKGIEAEKNKNEAEFNDLNSKRKEFIKNLNNVILSKYERVLHNRKGMAVVSVGGDVCGGCNMNLPPQVINEVRLRNDLIFCENCNRILYATE